MFSEYANFEIKIEPRRDDGFPFSVSASGGDARGVLRLPTDDDAYQQLAHQLTTFATNERGLQQLGEFLFRALIDQPGVRNVYDKTQGIVEEQRNLGLRITLNIGASVDDGVVGALPWEFLYDPDKGHLSLLDAPILRYIQQPFHSTPLGAVLPLKVLLTGAQVQEPLQVERELQAVASALADLSSNLAVEVEPHLTVATFRKLLRKGFHVWHFVGHGGTSEDGSGMLLFEDARDLGEAQTVSAEQLKNVLYRSGIQLVVLNACNSAQLVTAPLLSLAPTLIRAQVPAVIAMQFAVSDRSARVFATDFYSALAQGDPIDACVTAGRLAVNFDVPSGRPDWGIPVVYSRAANGKLFDLPASAPPAGQAENGNITIQGSTINAVNATFNTGTMSSTLPDDEAQHNVEALQQQITAWQKRLQFLRLQDARGAGTASTALDMQEFDTQLLDAHRQIIAIRVDQLARLKRVKQPDAATMTQIGEVNAELLDEQLTVAKAEFNALNNRLRIQTSASGRERIGAEVDAKKREIATLQQQRDAV